MYSIGLTLLFAITGVISNSLPPYPLQSKCINDLLSEKCSHVSREMTNIVKALTDRRNARRMDNIQLSRILRDKEGEIIKKESIEYVITKRGIR